MTSLECLYFVELRKNWCYEKIVKKNNNIFVVIADTFTNLSCYMSHDVKQGLDIVVYNLYPTDLRYYCYRLLNYWQLCTHLIYSLWNKIIWHGRYDVLIATCVLTGQLSKL